jgi:hypothetical protein
MLPVDTVVWAKAAAENTSAKAQISAIRPNLVLCRGELRFNIIHLPFGVA